MKINADFSKRVVVHSAALEWQDSPMPGVRRRMLDRIGAESGHATSIVSYAPGSHFSPHVHTGGEEFLVLEGVFQDEHGDFPAGSYIRNPPQSSHTPGSENGCVIFVKLCQFDSDDRTHIRTNIHHIASMADIGRPGVKVLPLYYDQRENVRLEIWPPNTQVEVDASAGAEILVLDGSFEESDDSLQKHSWLRTPVASKVIAKTGGNGASVWIKTGHLQHLNVS